MIRELRIIDYFYRNTMSMKVHKGMRPHDIAILLKIVADGNRVTTNKSIALQLFISQSEITESLSRSEISGLLIDSRRKVAVNAFRDFLFYGLKYVFPAMPGYIAKGMPTAHSAPVLQNYFNSAEQYVWADAEGAIRGASIDPLYPNAFKAARHDAVLYDLLALCDVLRIGKVREIKIARELISDVFNRENHVA